MKNKLESTYVTVEDKILMLIIVKEISAAMILDRRWADSKGWPF